MTDYKINYDVWLSQQVTLTKGVLRGHMDPNHEYTPQEVLDILSAHGLDYSNPEYIPIGQILVADGFLQAA